MNNRNPTAPPLALLHLFKPNQDTSKWYRNTTFHLNDRTLIIGGAERSPLLSLGSRLVMVAFLGPQLVRLPDDVHRSVHGYLMSRCRALESHTLSQYRKLSECAHADMNEPAIELCDECIRLEWAYSSCCLPNITMNTLPSVIIASTSAPFSTFTRSILPPGTPGTARVSKWLEDPFLKSTA